MPSSKAPSTLDATREAKQIRTRSKSCCKNSCTHFTKQQVMQCHAHKWDLAPFFSRRRFLRRVQCGWGLTCPTGKLHCKAYESILLCHTELLLLVGGFRSVISRPATVCREDEKDAANKVKQTQHQHQIQKLHQFSEPILPQITRYETRKQIFRPRDGRGIVPLFTPSATKSGRPYGVMYVSSWRTTPTPHHGPQG